MLQALLDVARPLLAPAVVIWNSPVTWLEIVASVLGVLMVLANLRVKPIGWPLAIASSLLYGLLFADSRLNGEAMLQVFFVVVAGWGWWQWLHARGSDGHALEVLWMTRNVRVVAIAGTLAAWPLLALLLDRGTDSDVPWLDALVTVASITGQILLGRKFIDNWPVWVGVNAVSIGLFAFKGLWLTVLLYAVFLLLAVAGWRAWQQRLAA